ncbi:MAG: toprim domain-containing protein [Polyangiaceae bacterium]|nr:toprim domain-containing protein [Polyangiaceae bacterium]
MLAHYGLLDKLQRRGNRLSGLSPFRKETRPSFFVSLDGNKWNDYPRPTVEGKEVPGNVVGLVMAMENCTFREALVKLHDLAGFVSPPPRTPAAPAAVAAATSANVGAVLAEPGPVANEPFAKELRGLRYDVPFLEQRGLPADRARYWGVGYCSRGLMKGRIVIPIRNRVGELVAYIGRSLKHDDPEQGTWRFPKGFHKSIELFGVDRLARDAETQDAVRKFGVIVVEGAFDAISLVEKGFKNTVSTLGSDVSAKQRALLVDPELNPSRRVTIFFDNDEAGRHGRKKLAGDLLFAAFVRYVDFSRIDRDDRTDPDEYCKDELDKLLR